MACEERRAQLVETCARIVDTEGFHAATIERVAAECGVTRTVVYQHFGGLGGMFAAVVERASARAAEAFARAVADGGAESPADAMARILDAADEDPSTWRLFLVIPPAGPPALIDALERGRAAIRRHVSAGLSASSRGRLADPELAARFLQVVADEAVRLRIADPTVFGKERLVRQYRTLFDALVGSGPSSPGSPSSPGEPARRRRAEPDWDTINTVAARSDN
jgi:AcrR family transcriptional regulator